jgi:hypothetical protein
MDVRRPAAPARVPGLRDDKKPEECKLPEDLP